MRTYDPIYVFSNENVENPPLHQYTILLLICSLTLLSIHVENHAVFLNPLLKDEAEQTRRSISHHHSKQLSPSEYFFDHVSGAIRLEFHKLSIQEWERVVKENDYVDLRTEDRSKAVFASDDWPVDNDVRNEASKNGSRTKVSTLKEEWDGWFHFHKNRQLLKRNKMFSSDLYPISNPMQQDLDMPLPLYS